MSEVVPLPSFGEVFFDARGQDRVLRVTWHDGTLVLSLWRGEMCTASFRMPMNDVGRLIDTLDEGFSEAGGQDQDAGTGPFPRQGTDQDGYGSPEAYAAHVQEHAQEHPQEHGPDAQSREAYAAQVHDPYATQVQDAYAGADAYAGQSGDGYAAHDPYGTAQHAYGQARDAYPADDGHAAAPDGYGQDQDPYGRGRDGYGQDQDGYGRGRDGYTQAESGYGGHDRRGAHDGGFPGRSSDYDYPDYPGTGQYARPPVPPPAPAPEAYPAPAALGPNDVLVARGTPTQDRLVASSTTVTGPQPAQRPAPQPAGVDPNDPLGLGAVRPYVNEPPLYTTGERLRPDQWPADQVPDPHAEHERRGGRRSGQPAGQWPDDGAESWENARGW